MRRPRRRAPARDATSAGRPERCCRATPRRPAERAAGARSADRTPPADEPTAPAARSRATRARRGTGPRAPDRTIRPSRPSALLLDGDHDAEPEAHTDHAAVDEELHRSLALPQDLADLGELEILAELQGHGRPLLRREVVDGRPDACSLGAVDDSIVDRASRIGDSDRAVEARGRFAAAVMIIDCVDADLIEPGAEWVP